jgi:hypothetical protein
MFVCRLFANHASGGRDLEADLRILVAMQDAAAGKGPTSCPCTDAFGFAQVHPAVELRSLACQRRRLKFAVLNAASEARQAGRAVDYET